MKPLTPTSEWIGMLIGIMVFGSIVGHVAAQAKCWKPAKLTNVKEIAIAMTAGKGSEHTCTKISDSKPGKCIQYVSPTDTGDRKGKVELLTECGEGCALNQAAIDGKFLARNYKCYDTCEAEDSSKCKSLTEILGASPTACYEHMGKKAVSEQSVPQVYCMDGCKYLNYDSDTRTGANTGPGVFAGCSSDCDDLKTNAVSRKIAASADCVTCAGLSACKPHVVMTSPCWATTNAAVTTVQAITEAMSDAKSFDCGSGEKCVQFKTPTGTNDRKGKVHVMIGCTTGGGATCPVIDRVKFGNIDGYTCEKCVRGSDCKNIGTIAGEHKKCYEYNNEAKPTNFVNVDQVYCMDKCQYSIWTDSANKKKYFLGCASDCEKFKSDNSGAACTDCANDEECKKMGGEKSPDGNNPNTGTGATSPTNNQATTKPTKNCNEVTGATYLIGCMAILIYAACHYMRQL